MNCRLCDNIMRPLTCQDCDRTVIWLCYSCGTVAWGPAAHEQVVPALWMHVHANLEGLLYDALSPEHIRTQCTELLRRCGGGRTDESPTR